MWARASAGVVAGFFLSAAIIGLVSWSLPGPWQSTLVAGLLAFFPVWTGVIALAFAFRNGVRAWWCYGGLALAGLSLLWLLQRMQWVQ